MYCHTVSQDFTIAEVQRLLTATIFTSSQDTLPIHIKSINSWVMHAEVAAQYSNTTATTACRGYNNVFLVGDAAHRFPPSGGFGMNTGIQDAHNIAWKLAMVIQGTAERELLTKTYEQGKEFIGYYYYIIYVYCYYVVYLIFTLFIYDYYYYI